MARAKTHPASHIMLDTKSQRLMIESPELGIRVFDIRLVGFGETAGSIDGPSTLTIDVSYSALTPWVKP